MDLGATGGQTPVLGLGQFYGSRGGKREVGGFVVTESRYAPLAHIPEHLHENAFFSFVLSGDSREQAGSSEYERVPRMLVFHPRRERHESRWGRVGGSCLHVEISGETTEAMERQGLGLSSSTILKSPMVCGIGSRLIDEFRTGDTASSLAIEGLVLELLAQISRTAGATSFKTRIPPWLEEARLMVAHQYHRGIGVTEMAVTLGVTPSHLAASYRRAFGCTLGEDVRRHRIADACGRLLESDATLGAIAVECGFADQAHFSKVFRSAVGKSPGQFRRDRLALDKRYQKR